MDNVIEFYVRLNDQVTSGLKQLKRGWEQVTDEMSAVAHDMVASIEYAFENAFKRVDVDKTFVSKFRKGITSVHRESRRMRPIKIPIEADFSKAVLGTALGAMIGASIGKIDIPEQAVKAKLRPEIGSFGKVIECLRFHSRPFQL